jgi:tetratricopeptide (TPR) repeat protein
MRNDQLRLFRKAAVVLAAVAVLPGCAKLSMYDLTDQFGFMHSYKAAKDDFDRGRVMEARSEVLSMDKNRPDYKQALALLNNKIEPARLRLLNYYTAKAAAAEKDGDWAGAMGLYEQAAGFSTSPASLVRKQEAMSLKMRQVRLDALLDQRRREDAAILSWQSSYEPPKGVAANDAAFRREREYYASQLDERASNTYSEAKNYLRSDMPDLAYVEIESYLRYVPDSEQGKAMLAQIRKQMPKGLQIPSAKAVTARPRVPAGPIVRQPEPNSVDVADIRTQMAQKNWLEARRLALIYRREGGAGAAALLEQIQAQISSVAAAAFQNGSLAFRKENIDEAVRQWSKAAALMPDEPEYVESLQRAKQLQDRLRVLREAASENAPKAGNTAPAGK